MAQQNPKNTHHAGSLLSYSLGFALSVLLTVAAYVSAVNHSLPGNTLIAVIIGLAIAQLMVQLIFFLHLGSETKPRLRLTIFLFMLVVLAIVVGGSLWIMHNLDYNMMPHNMDKYMMDEEGIYR